MSKIAVFIDHPRCSIHGVNGIMNVLQPYYQFKIFTKHEILYEDWFDDVSMIAVPGGLGDAETFHRVMRPHIPKIRDFILNDGGRYLGICMGAYWAGSEYLNLLKDRDCVQYLTQPNTDTHRPHAKNLPVTWNGEQEKMFWYDGCSIIGNGKFDVVATYPNGDAMAGYQDRIGLIGSHPEAQRHWYTEYSWMNKVWDEDRQKRNHRLLLEFVDELIRR
ncbi:Biotin-protein ligase, N-terminal [uncultured Caudovirales phage]|uniref:Biotin-protein ligase, N-terminal n=1 Tax=uncultured Caudovirales phage TaxID=2100421 RepID=A0A6J7WUN8_9CAUD|nr:Biotin-protein ligase, N-terminal [uncultured Caudovirales phage]